jgi:hypothetical protein
VQRLGLIPLRSLREYVTPYVSILQGYGNQNLRVQWEIKSGFEFKVFKFLYSVDQLTQSAIFENLLEFN